MFDKFFAHASASCKQEIQEVTKKCNGVERRCLLSEKAGNLKVLKSFFSCVLISSRTLQSSSRVREKNYYNYKS